MSDLNRIQVGDFKIKDSIKIEELKNGNISNFISIEDFFAEEGKIVLDLNDMTRFLNGVKLHTKENDGIYKIYNQENCFIGTGIVKDEVLKRDIII